MLDRQVQGGPAGRPRAAHLLVLVRRRRLAASDNPRWDFAHLPALYKLYVIRETGGRTTTLDDDPAADFLRRLLPEASRVLSQP